MQDQYFGDVGDYVKYGLLRAMMKHAGIGAKLGVIWYKTPKDRRDSNDGKHDRYLTSPATYRKYDPDLFDCLHRARRKNDSLRAVKTIEESGLLGDATFFGVEVPKSLSERRESWFVDALRRVAEADILFLDPDNGLETTSPNSKHVLWSEIQLLLKATKPRTLIIYQQQIRESGFPERHLAECASRLGTSGHLPLGVVARRGTVRAFLTLAHSRHKDFVQAALNELTATWTGNEKERFFEPTVFTATASKPSEIGSPGVPASASAREDRLPKANDKLPTGIGCYCGCSEPTKSYFAPGHDRRVEAWLLAKGVSHEELRAHSRAALALRYGYGPKRRMTSSSSSG